MLSAAISGICLGISRQRPLRAPDDGHLLVVVGLLVCWVGANSPSARDGEGCGFATGDAACSLDAQLS